MLDEQQGAVGDRGETAEYVATSPTEILVLDLPRVAREASHAAAAE